MCSVVIHKKQIIILCKTNNLSKIVSFNMFNVLSAKITMIFAFHREQELSLIYAYMDKLLVIDIESMCLANNYLSPGVSQDQHQEIKLDTHATVMLTDSDDL